MCRMNIKWFALAAMLLTSPLYAGQYQDQPKPTSDKAMEAKKEPTAEEKTMMEKMQKAGAPGSEHAILASMVGNWNVQAKHWKDPGKAPSKSSGTAEFRSLFDGRFIEEIHKGDMMGMPFEGRGTMGYDNLAKKYVSTWIDSWSTQIMFMKGTYDAASKTFSSTGTYTDPNDGKSKTMKMTRKMIDNNNALNEFWEQKADGRLVKMMELRYSRQM